MSGSIVDEPELAHVLIQYAATLPPNDARFVIKLVETAYEAGFINGRISRIVPSPALQDALSIVKRIGKGEPPVPLRSVDISQPDPTR